MIKSKGPESSLQSVNVVQPIISNWYSKFVVHKHEERSLCLLRL